MTMHWLAFREWLVAKIGANFFEIGVGLWPRPLEKTLWPPLSWDLSLKLWAEWDLEKFLSVSEVAEIGLEPAKNWPRGFLFVEFYLGVRRFTFLKINLGFVALRLVGDLLLKVRLLFLPVKDLAEAKGVVLALVKKFGPLYWEDLEVSSYFLS